MLNFSVILEFKTFFKPEEKLNKMEMNKWIAPFVTHLQSLYLNNDLAFAYNDLLQKV